MPTQATFRQLLEGNDAILVVRLKPDPANPKKYARNAELLEIVSNRQPLLEGGKTVPLNRDIEGDKPVQPKVLIIVGARLQGQWDWHLGIDASVEAVRCMKGFSRLDAKDNQKVLGYLFDYLTSTNQLIASAAYAEWTQAAAADVRRVAKQLPTAKVRRLVQDENATVAVRAFAAFLLGHCGDEKDVVLIRQLIEARTNASEPLRHYEELLKGYILLKPKEGWALTRASLGNPAEEFMTRYQCLRAARYFHTVHPDVIAKKDIEQLFADTLCQDDIADFLIEDFRKWRCWDHTGRVLALLASKPHQLPIIKRAILRYALCCPDPACGLFVTDQRRRDREWVADTEEILKLEEP